MIFGQSDVKIEASEDITTIHSGVGDIGVIFQILSGLYNDPQRIIVQEYVANARDAHREMGKQDVPIQITLPTYIQSELKIRDFGPGISPDRMKNVFVLYGASTKRSDNFQTGGFGIGAKSVFCYTDSCTIETWVDGMYYCYCYMVGENKKPDCLLMDSHASDEPTGTMISINIMKNDISTVCNNVYYVTQYWKVRPFIKNEESHYGNKYSEYSELSSGNGWRFLKNRNTKSQCIIDEIPYKFDYDAVFKESEDRNRYSPIFNSGNFDFILNTGDVTMSPNREGPIYDVVSRKVFKSIVERAIDEIKERLISELKQVDNIFDALDALKNAERYKDLIGVVSWRNVQLSDRIVLNNEFYQIWHVWRSRSKNKVNQTYDMPVSRGIKYYITSESDIPPGKIKTLLLTHSSVYVIKQLQYDPNIHTTYASEDIFNEARNEYDENINIKSFGLVDLSTVEKYKNPRKDRTDKVNIYEYSPIDINKSMVNWNRMNVNFDDINGVYVEYERGISVGYTLNDLSRIMKTFNIKIYGVPSKYIKIANKTDGLEHMNAFVLSKLHEMAEYIKDNNDIIYAKEKLPYTANSHVVFRRATSDIRKILIKSELGEMYYNASNKIIDDSIKAVDHTAIDKYNLLCSLTRTNQIDIINPTYDIEKIANDLIKEYPLLNMLSSFSISSLEKEHLAYYLEYMVSIKPTIPSTNNVSNDELIPF